VQELHVEIRRCGQACEVVVIRGDDVVAILCQEHHGGVDDV
jgi:hypothetical protein